MANILLAALGAIALTTSTLAAQPQSPASQPVRPPERPPTSEPATRPEPPFAGRPRTGTSDGETSAPAGEPRAGTLTLQGCIQRPTTRSFRLRHVEGNDSTVSEDVTLGGDVEQLRSHVGRVVQVRGTYEQETPTTAPPTFRVERVRGLTGTCAAK